MWLITGLLCLYSRSHKRTEPHPFYYLCNLENTKMYIYKSYQKCDVQSETFWQYILKKCGTDVSIALVCEFSLEKKQGWLVHLMCQRVSSLSWKKEWKCQSDEPAAPHFRMSFACSVETCLEHPLPLPFLVAGEIPKWKHLSTTVPWQRGNNQKPLYANVPPPTTCSISLEHWVSPWWRACR